MSSAALLHAAAAAATNSAHGDVKNAQYYRPATPTDAPDAVKQAARGGEADIIASNIKESTKGGWVEERERERASRPVNAGCGSEDLHGGEDLKEGGRNPPTRTSCHN